MKLAHHLKQKTHEAIDNHQQKGALVNLSHKKKIERGEVLT